MENKKAKFFFILWVVFILLGSIFSAAYEALNFFKLDFVIQAQPYTNFQIFLLLIYVPLCLIPLLGASCFYAIKEKNLKIKIASICLIVHHIICMIAVLLQVF